MVRSLVRQEERASVPAMRPATERGDAAPPPECTRDTCETWRVGVVVALVAALVVALQRPWTRVVVRVVGSWRAARGLFMCGWFLRGCCH